MVSDQCLPFRKPLHVTSVIKTTFKRRLTVFKRQNSNWRLKPRSGVLTF
ncbi:hypothetical protein Zm00014a_030764 [Zea mays]|uniref:Uncharacterized protein n=1 Tax=Zea mays TaxID=4577 RepID=A0A3L6FTR0_MAIZE|nr:hypothetical protein Zm00014a_030764 [Zea mays]